VEVRVGSPNDVKQTPMTSISTWGLSHRTSAHGDQSSAVLPLDPITTTSVR